MSETHDLISETQLQFFGGMTASISHELKNALAIIQENAGLLGDYMLMMDKGNTVAPERLKKVARRIEEQTRRADLLIRKMNRFAHTVDEPSKTVDLNEMTALLVALLQRTAAMREVSLKAQPEASPVMITTAPFLLLAALGRWALYALQAVSAGQTLLVRVARGDAGIQVVLEPLAGLADLARGTPPGEREFALLNALNAGYNADISANRIVMTFHQG